MLDAMLKDTDARMDHAVEAVRRDLAGVRTGRASIALLDRVTVSAYGSDMPLNQVAALASPEAALLTVKPFDVSLLPAIEKALLKADIGITPNNDGKIIRLPVPPLTEERRKQLSRKVSEMVEAGKTALRNVRRDANDLAKKAEKDGDAGQDDVRRALERVQELTAAHTKTLDTMSESKTQEIMTV